MPQGEQFWNPYRLIPVRESVERSAPWTDERFRGKSGLIACTLENLTPLFVGAQSSGSMHPPAVKNGKRIIPGSSLKGMLRSLAEIVGGGCFVVSNNQATLKIPASPVPPSMSCCSDVGRLCVACRMFGAMERGQNARVHKGKISVGDALIREDRPRVKTLQVLLNNNGVRHEPFYRSTESGVMDGKSRKLYFHQPQRRDSLRSIPENIRDRAWDVAALLPGHHFFFDVQFTGLTDDEYRMLLYIICLEDEVRVEEKRSGLQLSGPMRHKIGNAKPLGMGSCCIQINRLTLLAPPAERFCSLTVQNHQVFEGESLKAETQRRIQPFIDDKSPSMQALRKMMVWDENDSREFRYPDYHWFSNTANAQTPLKEF